MADSPYSGRAFKTGARQFLFGKVATGILTFALLISLARLLPAVEYGKYLALIAAFEIIYLVGNVGLPRLAFRSIPEYRLKASAQRLRRHCLRLVFSSAAVLLPSALVAYALFDWYIAWGRLEVGRSLHVVIAVFVVAEGLHRFIVQAMLGALMQQVSARICMWLRQAVVLGSVWTLFALNRLSVEAILVAEVTGALLSLSLGATLLARHVRSLGARSAHEQWHERSFSAQWAAALRVYLSGLISIAGSQSVVLNLVQRFAGAEAAAAFGFAGKFTKTVSHYLPVNVFLNLLKPKIVAARVVDESSLAFARQTTLAIKLNWFVAGPLVGVAFFLGEYLMSALSGGNLGGSGLVLFTFMLGMAITTGRGILDAAAMASNVEGATVMAAVCATSALPVSAALLWLGFGATGAAVGLVAGALAYNGVLSWRMSVSGPYKPDVRGLAKIGLATLAASLLAFLVLDVFIPAVIGTTAIPRGGLLHAAAMSVLIVAAYLGVSAIIRPFDAQERQALNKFIGRRVFIF